VQIAGDTPAMPEWTKKSFDEIEDTSPDGVDIQWRFARRAMGFEQVGVSRFTFPPNSRFPFAHRHREQEEAYVVVGGSGRVKLDDDVVEVERWDLLRVGPSVGRQFEAGPEGLELICIGGPVPEGGDGEPVPDFWD
jgi:mannose-6-phosphate isomerase-like protein (cupin superfamily)